MADANRMFETRVTGAGKDEGGQAKLLYVSEPLEDSRADHPDFQLAQADRSMDRIGNSFGVESVHR